MHGWLTPLRFSRKEAKESSVTNHFLMTLQQNVAHSNQNERVYLQGLASYVNKYMSTYTILTFHPFPINVKETQKLAEYEGGISSQNKKLTALNQEKKLKSTQEKAASILGPLTRPLSIMEAEREILQEDDAEVDSAHKEITG